MKWTDPRLVPACERCPQVSPRCCLLLLVSQWRDRRSPSRGTEGVPHVQHPRLALSAQQGGVRRSLVSARGHLCRSGPRVWSWWPGTLRPVCLVPLLFVSLPATRPFCFTCVRFLPPGRQHLCAPGTKKALICLLSCSLWVEGGRETGCWAWRTTEAVRAGLQRQSGCAQGGGARRCTCARSLRCVSPGVPGPVCLDRETPVDEDFREGFLEQEASVAPESRTAPRERQGGCL